MLNHMEPVSSPDSEGYFLPHHVVIKGDSTTTKVRIVFDGSAKTTTGISLNDQLMIGPRIQQDLFSILCRFRSHRFVITADIEKMYRPIIIHPDDRRYQKILWRISSDQPIKTYQLLTVTFGIASAPFLAIRCLREIADKERNRFPKAWDVILNDFCVDDILTGANTIDELLQLRNQITQVLDSAGFPLNKWASNTNDVLPSDSSKINKNVVSFQKEDATKVLGLKWYYANDTFGFSLKDFEVQQKETKRSILSQIARLFDPLGLIGPVIVTAKLIMQDLWKLNTRWDEQISSIILNSWLPFKNDLHLLRELRVPRCISDVIDQNVTYELHGFWDASEKAYGACVYIKSININSRVKTVNLLCSKSRVAPLKTLSLPRRIMRRGTA